MDSNDPINSNTPPQGNAPGLPPPFPGLPAYVAHTPPKSDPDHWHLLEEHILEVTRRAEEFAEAFDGEHLARYVGLLHDLGKFDIGFQRYLWECYQADHNQRQRPKAGSAPHKQAGALVAWNDPPLFGKEMAQILFGHHGGMLSEPDTFSKSEEWQRKVKDPVEEMRRLAASLNVDVKPPTIREVLAFFPPRFREPGSPEQEMYLRFVFSCLTDADGLDTEAHKNPQNTARREAERASTPTLAMLRDMLRESQSRLLAETAAREAAGEMTEQERRVNAVRRAVYEDCQRTGKSMSVLPGVFTLTVPTGGGKTRSALAFGLEHGATHGKRRVIYAAPFTSILDQTAVEFTRIFGEDSRVVLEHHSAVDPPEPEEGKENDETELWRRLAAENWDAPLIVTTQVQLFESLFSNRPGKCRKLHRIANSVLILDEVQSLPPRLLAPLVSALNVLSRCFGVTIVLCTATQPALSEKTAYLAGFDTPPQEIVHDHAQHFSALRRVRYQVRKQPMDWEEVAKAVRGAANEAGGCLCIVNTRRSAKDLTDLLDPDRDDEQVFHLSTLLCGRHRRSVLEDVHKRLELMRKGAKEGKPTILISTSVIEAGVHIDFPHLFRALAPLPSIIQAAGRCNREGKRDPNASLVTVFTPKQDMIPADSVYQQARAQTKNALDRADRKGTVFPFDDPEAVTGWFRQFLHDLNNQTDAFEVMPAIQERQFDEVAKKVRLVPDETVPVLPLRYAPQECQDILDSAVDGRLTRDHWRALRPFLVSIFATDAAKQGLKEDEYPGLYIWHGEYDVKTGLPLDADPGDGIVRPPDNLIVSPT